MLSSITETEQDRGSIRLPAFDQKRKRLAAHGPAFVSIAAPAPAAHRTQNEQQLVRELGLGHEAIGSGDVRRVARRPAGSRSTRGSRRGTSRCRPRLEAGYRRRYAPFVHSSLARDRSWRERSHKTTAGSIGDSLNLARKTPGGHLLTASGLPSHAPGGSSPSPAPSCSAASPTNRASR